MRRQSVAIVLATLCAAGLASPAAADVVVGSAHCPTVGYEFAGCSRVSALGGWVVWSNFVAGAGAKGAYRLMAAHHGVSRPIRVPTRLLPFDLDVGRDRAGRLVVSFSRCAGDPGGPVRGCVAEVVGPAGGRERQLLRGLTSTAPLHPSVWGDRVAVAVRPAGRFMDRIRLCATSRRGSCRALPAGPSPQICDGRGRCHPVSRGAGAPGPPMTAGAQALDLGPRALAIAWAAAISGVGDAGDRTEIAAVGDVDARRPRLRRIAGADCCGEGYSPAVLSPSLSGRRVYYVRSGACGEGNDGLRFGRYDLATGRDREVDAPFASAVAVDGRRLYWAPCGTPARAVSDQRILLARPDPFTRPALVPRGAPACPRLASAGRAWTAALVPAAGGAFSRPALAVAHSGAAAVAWIDDQGAWLSLRRPGGTFWAAVHAPNGMQPGQHALEATPPALAVTDAGEAILAWVVPVAVSASHLTGTAYRVMSATVAPDGTMSAPALVGTGAVGFLPAVRLAADARGDAVLAWSDVDGIAAAYRPAGAAFAVPRRLSTGTTSSELVAIDPAGDATVTWLDQPGAFSASTMMTQRPAAGDFTPARTLLAKARPAALAVDAAGRLTLLVEGGSPTASHPGTQLLAVTADPDGRHRAATRLSVRGLAQADPYAPPPPALALNRLGDAVAIWAEGDSSGTAILASARRRQGAWSRARSLAVARDARLTEPHAALDPRRDAIALWTMQCPGKAAQLAAAWRPAGGSFATGLLLVDALSESESAVGIADSGDALVASSAGVSRRSQPSSTAEVHRQMSRAQT